MDDCRLLVEVKNGKVNIFGEHITAIELATISGYLEEMSGYKAYRGGMDIDDIKMNLLDMHLSAMRELDRHIRRERGNGQ